jgi:hypothetical protein
MSLCVFAVLFKLLILSHCCLREQSSKLASGITSDPVFWCKSESFYGVNKKATFIRAKSTTECAAGDYLLITVTSAIVTVEVFSMDPFQIVYVYQKYDVTLHYWCWWSIYGNSYRHVGG